LRLLKQNNDNNKRLAEQMSFIDGRSWNVGFVWLFLWENGTTERVWPQTGVGASRDIFAPAQWMGGWSVQSTAQLTLGSHGIAGDGVKWPEKWSRLPSVDAHR
jgi:hypothetical protein